VTWGWRRFVALAVPLAVFFFGLGFFFGLEVQRGPNWGLELDAYISEQAAAGETVCVAAVSKARRPEVFTAAMGRPAEALEIWPSFPAQEVRCVLVERTRPGDDGAEMREQVVFLVYHSDTLYRVGWVVYEGAEGPFGPAAVESLRRIGCDLALE